jgi:hypothetical protein
LRDGRHSIGFELNALKHHFPPNHSDAPRLRIIGTGSQACQRHRQMIAAVSVRKSEKCYRARNLNLVVGPPPDRPIGKHSRFATGSSDQHLHSCPLCHKSDDRLLNCDPSRSAKTCRGHLRRDSHRARRGDTLKTCAHPCMQ